MRRRGVVEVGGKDRVHDVAGVHPHRLAQQLLQDPHQPGMVRQGVEHPQPLQVAVVRPELRRVVVLGQVDSGARKAGFKRRGVVQRTVGGGHLEHGAAHRLHLRRRQQAAEVQVAALLRRGAQPRAVAEQRAAIDERRAGGQRHHERSDGSRMEAVTGVAPTGPLLRVDWLSDRLQASVRLRPNRLSVMVVPIMFRSQRRGAGAAGAASHPARVPPCCSR